MKKLFTLFAAGLLCATASQAAITVKCGDKNIENNGEITLTRDDLTIEDFGEGLVIWELGTHVIVTSDAAPVQVSVESTTDGAQFCPAGGNCLSLKKDTDGLYKTTTTFNAASTSINIHEGTMGAVPESVETMTVKCEDADGDNFTFSIKFDLSLASINGVDADEATPVYYNMQGIRVANPEKGQILIRKAGSKVSKVVIR